ncbi:MAG: DUF721 domain-containing protein [Candidatus Zixiibacteriota bacterium]|nr:MAG: DUF721 domain-containing protein [candidate division Zixibacteria bacterium]
MVAHQIRNAKRTTIRIGSLLDKVMADLGLTSDLAGWKIVNDWPKIVGHAIARVTRPVRYEDHTLLISVPDAVWRQQLSLEVEMILGKIHTVPGGRAIKRIRFVA